LRLGSVNGPLDEVLFQVVGAVRLTDGRVVVGNGGTRQLLYFDRQGKLQKVAGGRGDGPGEFQRLSWIGRAGGDSVAAFDYRARRVTIFGADGLPGRVFPLQPFPAVRNGEPPVVGAPRMLGRFGSGHFLVAARPSASTGSDYEGVPEDTVHYFVYDSSGAPTTVHVAFPGSEQWVRTSEGQVTMMAVPFGRTTHAAIGPESFWIGGSDSWRIYGYTMLGELRSIVLRNMPERSVTPADVQRYKARRLQEAAEAPEWQRELRRHLEVVPIASVMPTFSSFLVDDLGYLWIEDYSVDTGSRDQTSVWHVFDRTGRPVASAQLPRGIVLQIGRDFLVIHRRDELAVEHVEVYGLDRAQGADSQTTI
jgi:hypothetical protein